MLAELLETEPQQLQVQTQVAVYSPMARVLLEVLHSSTVAMVESMKAQVALAAVAGVMFLVLDRQLKDHHLNSGLFRSLPPVRELLVSMQRLLWLGMAMLTIGVVAGFMMGRTGDANHLIAAVLVWLAYVALIIVKQVRGMTGRRFSMAVVLLFVVSLSVFAFI